MGALLLVPTACDDEPLPQPEPTPENRNVTVHLLLPSLQLAPYTSSTRAADGWQLRCIAEVYGSAADTCLQRAETLCQLLPDGNYTTDLALELIPAQYRLLLWLDWMHQDSTYYKTDRLDQVQVKTAAYASSAKKDAYYAASTLDTTQGEDTLSIELIRPLAQYRLIASDVEAYRDLIAKGDTLPPIEELQARVTYEGFFPTGFNVATGQPNDALNAGIHYVFAPTAAEGYEEATARQVGADFVLAGDEESFVTVTLQLVDVTTGKAVSTVQHVKIPYRRGHLTTVSGHFLTAGKTTGGVQINTEWDKDIVIEF